MDLVRTVLLYMMMLVNTATGASPSVTPMPASALPTPTPYVTQAPTAVPTVAPTARATRYNTLYVGDKGTSVRALQNRLKELGYLTGNVDGSYGAQTKTAVENFQRANGLKVDGIAGRNTQQIMFESPDVVWARMATLIPTIAPVTPTPIAPAVVAVRYIDASTGTLIRQTTVQCYADTNVYADASMVPATYRLVSNSYVAIRVANGIASPASVTFYYQRGSTATPNIGVSVPVYYLDSTNLIIARETRTLYQSGAVAADTARIPAGYTLSGSSVVYVNLSGNTASPNPVLFRLNRSQPTATPAPATGVIVPVYYINNSTGRTFASQNVTLFGSGTIYPQANLVPAGYTLIGNAYASVTVSNGRANPGTVSFRYQPYQPTATPIVGVTVPITYVDAATNVILYNTSVSMTSSQYVYADLSRFPGYTLASAGSVYVTVRNGQASPSGVTYRLNRPVTPTPAPRQISLQVRYLYGNRLVGSQTVYLQTGTTSYVYADAAVYGSNYVISGATSTRVIVSAAGVASPSVVTFYVVPRATATPTKVPSFQVSVPVRYQYGTQIIANSTVSIQNGTTAVVKADSSVYSSRYELASDASVRVTVTVAGAASPSVVVFYLVPKTTEAPVTPVPVSEVPVSVRYMSGSNLVASYQELCQANATTTVYANPSVYEPNYTLIGDSYVNVRVDASGNANPPWITFNLEPVQPITPEPITPAPQPEPGYPVPVPVQYRYGSEVLFSTVVMLESGSSTTIQSDPNLYPDGYILDGSDRVTVTVSADGVADPNPVIFYLVPVVEPITPAPAPVDPTEPPSGNRNTTFSYHEYSWSAHCDVYQGPGYDYYRAKNANVGGGKIRIYGTDGDWLLIGYGTSSGDYHIGYITGYTLPSAAKNVRPVVYGWVPATTKAKVDVTMDPVSNMKKLESLPAGTAVTFMGWASSKKRYAMIEYMSPSYGQMVRAFVKGSNLQFN